jgi:Phage tail tube protein
MSMSLVSGVSNITIDGAIYPCGDDVAKFDMSTIDRTPVMSKNGSVYMKESPVASKISFSILIDGTTDPSTFNALNNSNIVVQLATGSTLTCNGFATSGENEYDAGEGKMSLSFFGPRINVSLGS